MSRKEHPAASIFPMMLDDAYQKLKADIDKNGQNEPIVFYRGQLLDGRNRAKACDELGITPLECELNDDDDPVAYVLSANLHRRHLNESQRAKVAAKIKKLREPAAKERKAAGSASGGKTAGRGRKKQDANSLSANLHQTNGEQNGQHRAADEAAALLNVSPRAVYYAETVETYGSKELNDAVDRGEVAVSRAAAVAKNTPKREQLEAAKEKPKTKKKTPYQQLQYWWERADSAAKTRFRLFIDGECK